MICNELLLLLLLFYANINGMFYSGLDQPEIIQMTLQQDLLHKGVLAPPFFPGVEDKVCRKYSMSWLMYWLFMYI